MCHYNYKNVNKNIKHFFFFWRGGGSILFEMHALNCKTSDEIPPKKIMHVLYMAE